MEKLTMYQNRLITALMIDMFHDMTLKEIRSGEAAEQMSTVRRLLISQFEEINLRSRHGYRANRKTSQ